MSVLIVALNVLVILRAAVAWIAEKPSAEELERAEFRASSWPSREKRTC